MAPWDLLIFSLVLNPHCENIYICICVIVVWSYKAYFRCPYYTILRLKPPQPGVDNSIRQTPPIEWKLNAKSIDIGV